MVMMYFGIQKRNKNRERKFVKNILYIYCCWIVWGGKEKLVFPFWHLLFDTSFKNVFVWIFDWIFHQFYYKNKIYKFLMFLISFFFTHNMATAYTIKYFIHNFKRRFFYDFFSSFVWIVVSMYLLKLIFFNKITEKEKKIHFITKRLLIREQFSEFFVKTFQIKCLVNSYIALLGFLHYFFFSSFFWVVTNLT